MNTLGYVAIGAGLSQVVLASSLLAAGHLTGLPRKLYALLMFAVLSYFLIPLFDDWGGQWVLAAASTLVPGAFWLFASSLFDDHYEFPPWQPVLVALSVLMPTAFTLMSAAPGNWLEFLLVDVPQAGEFVFLALSLLVIFRSWKGDLVSTRRTLRVWFCGTVGVFILLLILAREVLFAGAAWLEYVQYLATAVVALGTNMILLRFRPGLLEPEPKLLPATPASEERERKPDLQEQLQPVIELVRREQLHREWGMTIGKLAIAADIPEYRLRQLINSGLGYRNFNDFLNRFRIEEASKRLSDPNEAKIPVLTIAIEAGFRSISTFNKAFKEIQGITPTAFRKRAIVD